MGAIGARRRSWVLSGPPQGVFVNTLEVRMVTPPRAGINWMTRTRPHREFNGMALSLALGNTRRDQDSSASITLSVKRDSRV
jgi:hypothetical protein